MSESERFNSSRRRFLERLSTLAGGAVLAASAPWLRQAVAAGSESAASASMGAGRSDTVRIGIVGVGSRGKLLLSCLQRISACRVVAVCDDYEPHLQRAMSLTHGTAKPFDDHRALIDWGELDAVLIATPLHLHAPIATDALEAGLHVFCEKAMARTIDGCAAMVARAKAVKRVLQIGHQRLFSPHYLEIAERVHRGDLGKVTQIRAYWHRNSSWRRPVPEGSDLDRRINWRLYRASSGGLATELATHQIQIASWMFQAVPTRVIGSGSLCYWRDGREVDDHIALIYDYSDGRKLIYDSMINNRYYGWEEQILGDRGTIEAAVKRFYPDVPPPPTPGLQQLIRDIGASRFSPIPSGGASWAPETKLAIRGEAIEPRTGGATYDANLLQLEAFCRAVRDGRPFPGLLRHAYYASVASLLGEHAMATGMPVEWPASVSLPEELFEL